MKKRSLFLLPLIFIGATLIAQNVGINVSGTTPSQNAILDLNTGNAKNLGLIIPRVVLGASLTTFNPPIAHAATGADSGMIVFNWQATNQAIGYYYWSGSTWISVTGAGGVGGSGTVNYLARWTPNATSLGIGVTRDNGTTVGINNAPVAAQMLTVTESTAANTAILGQNTAASGASTGVGVEGNTTQSEGAGVIGSNTNTSGTGIAGVGNNLGGAILASGSGGAFEGTAVGSYGLGTTVASGTGVEGVGNNIAAGSLLPGGSGGAFIGTTAGAYGLATSTTAGTGSTGVIGAGNDAAYSVLITNGSGGAFTGKITGAYGYASSAASGSGVVGIGNGGAYSAPASGSGGAFTGATVGAYGAATTGASGTGVIGAGNNQSSVILAGGSGGAFTGTTVGSYGYATSVANGTGVEGVGNDGANNYTPAGAAGGAFTGANMGVYGTTDGSNITGAAIGVEGSGTYGVIGLGTTYGGYFTDGTSTAQVGGSGYAILGTGVKSTEVMDDKGQYRVLHCPEAPEVLFEDFGSAQLSNGKVHINLDSLYAQNVTINEKHPLRVIITLNDPCNGVYVTNRTATGFDVIELNGGTSNASFTYEVIANRAPMYNQQHQILYDYADWRFEKGPHPLKTEGPPKSGDGQKILNTISEKTQLITPINQQGVIQPVKK